MSRLCAVWLPVCFLLVSCAKPPEPEPARSPNSSPAKALNPQLAEDVGVLREYLRKPNTPCFQEVANLSDYRDKGKVDRLEDGRFFAACEVVLASYERLADVLQAPLVCLSASIGERAQTDGPGVDRARTSRTSAR